MELRQLVMLVFRMSILCTVFGFGLRATPGDLLYLLRRPAILLRSLLAVLVGMPILAVALVRTFDLQPTAAIAVVALAISPVPPLLPAKEASAGGQQSYGLGLMVALALLSIVTVPAAVEVLQRVFDRPLRAAPGGIAGVVLTMTAFPLMAGMAVRAGLPPVADRLAQPVALVAKVLLPLTAVAMIAGQWDAVWTAVGDGTVAAMVAFVVIGLVVGHFLGGPDRDHAVVLALSTAYRHPAIALATASANFPDQRFVGTVLLYVIVATIVTLPYVAWQRSWTARSLLV
jgi:BASS family bile acid:Na+ symporter